MAPRPQSDALTPDMLEEAAGMIRVLGHPVRLQLVEALEHAARTVGELVDAAGVPQAIVSQQLARMRAAGIVTCRRDGSHVWYQVADPRVLRMLDCLRHCDTPLTPTARAPGARRMKPERMMTT